MGAQISMARTRSETDKNSTHPNSPLPDSPYVSHTNSEQHQQSPPAFNKALFGRIVFCAVLWTGLVWVVLAGAGARIAYDANLARQHANQRAKWHANSSQKVPTPVPVATLLALPAPPVCASTSIHPLIEFGEMPPGQQYLVTSIADPIHFGHIANLDTECVDNLVRKEMATYIAHDQGYWQRCFHEARRGDPACRKTIWSVECYNSTEAGRGCLETYSAQERATLYNMLAHSYVWQQCTTVSQTHAPTLGEQCPNELQAALMLPSLDDADMAPHVVVLKDESKVVNVARFLQQNSTSASAMRNLYAALLARNPVNATRPSLRVCTCGAVPECETVDSVEPRTVHPLLDTAQLAVRTNSPWLWNFAANLPYRVLPEIPPEETPSCKAAPVFTEAVPRNAACVSQSK